MPQGAARNAMTALYSSTSNQAKKARRLCRFRSVSRFSQQPAIRRVGIRDIDKSNRSGSGVVLPKELIAQLKHEPGFNFNQAGVYILVGNAFEETIYIGEADPVRERPKSHVANKEGWVWASIFWDNSGSHRVVRTSADTEIAAILPNSIIRRKSQTDTEE
jgi:hypothetical protein